MLFFNLGEVQMNKITILMAVLAMLGTNVAYAQSQSGAMGRGSAASSSAAAQSSGMPWVVGLATLGVLGTVVGVTASSASSTPSTFGH